MKKFFIALLLLSAVFVACKKDKNLKWENDDEEEFVLRSKVPVELTHGVWYAGTDIPISFFQRDGHVLESEEEYGIEFRFNNDELGKGRIKMREYTGILSYSGCANENFTYKEGEAGFKSSRFTFYPLAGNYNLLNSSCDEGDDQITGDYDESELEAVSFRYKLKTENGQKLLYLYLDLDVNMHSPIYVLKNAE